jgi:hypothetical protein
MATARYVHPNAAENPIMNTLVDLADQRVETGIFLDDIAIVL